ncbi:MAG: DUF2255 family protein [Pseudomonadales bacterium]|nr:DUF2255 family protein [Pseudomonadales bacterium]
MQKLLYMSLSPLPIWVAGAMLLSSCGAPLGPIPGGKLQGNVEAWPKDWSHAEDVENILLETNPTDPYSVTIWGLGIGDRFFVGASKRSNQWAENLENNPRAIIDVDGALYKAVVVRVTDAQLNAEVAQKFMAKYDLDPDVLEGDGAFYQLTAAPD